MDGRMPARSGIRGTMKRHSRETADFGKIIGIMGSFAAWIMGSGFATGQEILQFFTSYGMISMLMILVNFAAFLILGNAILKSGLDFKEDPDFRMPEYFCGRKLGAFYNWEIPLCSYIALIVLISGAGATLHEYYGLSNVVGSLLIIVAAYIAYIAGLQRFMKAISFIGPTIIAFVLIVGVITCLRDTSHLSEIGQYQDIMSRRQPAPFWWISMILYFCYNMTGGSLYYTAVGSTAETHREIRYGVFLGAASLCFAIFLMNTAMLSNIAHTGTAAIPTLYLARKISYVFGAVFSVILLLGIFSTSSMMLWTISSKFADQGTKKGLLVATIFAVTAFLLGLLPFTDLVHTLYPYLAYVDLPFIFCVFRKAFLNSRKRTGETERA
jgi:uncharacterized membrane protein YkvI